MANVRESSSFSRYDPSKYPTLRAALRIGIGEAPEEGRPSTSRGNVYSATNYMTLIGLLTTVAPRPRRAPSLQPTVFRGIVEESQKGVRPVIRYEIPGRSTCYVFEHLRTNQGHEVFRCSGCRKLGTTTSIANLHKSSGTPECADKAPRQLWQEVCSYIDYHSSEDPLRRTDMLGFFRGKGYESRRHAFSRCRSFLEYLRINWYAGPFKDLWNKWDVEELRTSNVAESFNRLLGVLLRRKHPLMSKLILALQGCVSEARGTLLYHEAHRTERKRIRRRDILRRRRVTREMNRFKSVLERTRGFLTTVFITTYCRRMSRFVTEKVV
ncbi:hypothetical protein GCK32_009220 [Trichostrongylus colubriformis]|uniref:Uncharacterized protein n=1 Tax=Trichostrongylus colubriformis TaxID=6319 RepID=A0AAN8FEL4_TRICO